MEVRFTQVEAFYGGEIQDGKYLFMEVRFRTIGGFLWR